MNVRGGFGRADEGLISFPASGVAFIQQAEWGCVIGLSSGPQIISGDDYSSAVERWWEELNPRPAPDPVRDPASPPPARND